MPPRAHRVRRQGNLGGSTVGAGELRDYVLGHADGIPKTPEWAEAISRAPAGRLRRLAHEMTAGRTLVNVVFALQRGEHGDQPVFAGLTLAAFLGQIGLPGGGYTHGFGSMGDFGVGFERVPVPFFPQGTNPVADFIPCARISDMLLRPGEEFQYDGRTLRYPEVKLAYWAGGNPFHHHQDLRRLTRALGRLDTFVVDEMHWTPTAKHADIVLPVASTLERDDIAAAGLAARGGTVCRGARGVRDLHRTRAPAEGGFRRRAQRRRLAAQDLRRLAGHRYLAAGAAVR